MLVEALSAALTTAHFASETVDLWSNPSHRLNAGHFVIAIDPQSFGGLDHTKKRIADLQRRVRASGDGRVLAPGDPEAESLRRNGIRVALASATCADLNDLTQRLGLPGPVPLDQM